MKNISDEYRQRVLNAFNRASKKNNEIKTTDIQIEDKIITDVPYYQHGNEIVFDPGIYNVLDYIKKER